MTAYTATHSAADLSGITIDVIVESGIAILSFVTLIVLVMLFVWLKHKVR
jgi:hypothetical protein